MPPQVTSTQAAGLPHWAEAHRPTSAALPIRGSSASCCRWRDSSSTWAFVSPIVLPLNCHWSSAPCPDAQRTKAQRNCTNHCATMKALHATSVSPLYANSCVCWRRKPDCAAMKQYNKNRELIIGPVSIGKTSQQQLTWYREFPVV